MKEYRVIVIGGSAGSNDSLDYLFRNLKKCYDLPVIIVQHMKGDIGELYYKIMNENSFLRIKEAEEKEKIKRGVIYFAPGDFHLLVENDETFTLTLEERENYSRPSIDSLFMSAADVYKDELIAVLLSGASEDGTKGMKRVKDFGGLTVVQDPETAQYPYMPKSAIKNVNVDRILSIEQIKDLMDKQRCD